MQDITPQEKEYRDGFTKRTIIGAFFVSLVIMPGSIYMGLVAGQTLGPAAQWVTIILFTEIARRSLTTLSRQEVYILYYVAAALAGGGVFAGLIWNQYLVQSPQIAAVGISHLIPHWAAPPANSEAITKRLLLHSAWATPILLVIMMQILGRLNWFGMGYILFRLTSDMERLPFPLAPIAAEGATALAESTTKEESWRWPVFSTGTMIGIIFGAIYIGIPALTGLIMTKPIMLFPIPFLDLTAKTEHILPGALAGISFDLGPMFWGMVLPFPLVLGMFISTTLTSLLGNPLLYKLGLFPSWRAGMSLIPTKLTTDFDFWMSITVGTGIAVALIGFYKVGKAMFEKRTEGFFRPIPAPQGRGDFPIVYAAGAFLLGTTGVIIICHKLVPLFPLWLLLLLGYVVTPLHSFVSARMVALTGSPVVLPFFREACILMSGYKGIDIWFAPIPVPTPATDYGIISQRFKELDLTGTKITSLIKAELLILPLGIICSLGFWAFFWYMNQIPSAQYPFSAKIWPIQAQYQALFMTATIEEGGGWLMKVFRLKRIVAGASLGLILYWLTTFLKLPILFYYGLLSGIANWPHGIYPMFIGALIGKKILSKRIGQERWRRYAPVIAAGYACGMGLVGMVSVSLALISKAITALPF